MTAAPADISTAIRETKAELRARIGDVAGAFRRAEEAMRAEVAEIVAERSRGESVWPVIQFSDIAAGTVPADLVEAVRRRGCAVVKGTFARERAEAWDAELVSYLDRNDFAGSTSTSTTASSAGWPRPGRRSSRSTGRGRRWRPARTTTWSPCADSSTVLEARIRGPGLVRPEPRHRLPGPGPPPRPRHRARGGLSAHTDSGSIERWLLPAYQNVFRHVYNGNPAAYDPWDGAYRTDVHEYESTVMCSAFRTFQGWTALSDMAPTEGVLHVRADPVTRWPTCCCAPCRTTSPTTTCAARRTASPCRSPRRSTRCCCRR